MIQEYDIREKIAEAVRKEISVPDLARWVMSNSWNMHQDSSDSAVDLASEIHLLLAERDNFQLDDASFLSEISALNSPLVLSAPIDVDVRVVQSKPYFVSSERWIRPVISPVAA